VPVKPHHVARQFFDRSAIVTYILAGQAPSAPNRRGPGLFTLHDILKQLAAAADP
jgi:hypothetical protein